MFTFRKYHRLNQQLIIIREVLVTVSKEVQSILDRTKKNSDLVKSVDLGMKALGKQVSDLQAQISALPVGNVLSDEDKSALATAASDLDNSINTLQSDIPANTDQGGKIGRRPGPERQQRHARLRRAVGRQCAGARKARRRPATPMRTAPPRSRCRAPAPAHNQFSEGTKPRKRCPGPCPGHFAVIGWAH
jgi:hypothetical protein